MGIVLSDGEGRPIGQLQTIQGYLAQLIMEILGADFLTMFTAFNMDKGRNVRGYAAKAKAFSAETVGRTMDIGSQIFGAGLPPGRGRRHLLAQASEVRVQQMVGVHADFHDLAHGAAARRRLDRKQPPVADLPQIVMEAARPVAAVQDS